MAAVEFHTLLAQTPAAGEPAGAPRRPASRVNAGRVAFAVHRAIDPVRDFWLALERERGASIYQRLAWSEAAAATVEARRGAEPFVVTGAVDGKPALLLPLARTRGPFAQLHWIGGTHVNFNMGLFSAEYCAAAGPDSLAELMSFLREAAGGNCLLRLCCQPAGWNGRRNPLLLLPHQRSANPAFFMDLSSGFEAMLASRNAKRKRKKFRAQERRAAALGGYALVEATTGAQGRELLEAFLLQKGQRLRSQGVANVFAVPGAREMMQRLADESVGVSEPMLRLYGLDVGGRIRAVFGGGLFDGHFSGYFSSIADDDFTADSPGEMLLYLVARHVAAHGVRSMDLGGGDERYKRSWCDRREELHDVIAPLGPMAWPAAAAARLHSCARTRARESETIWRAVRAVRRLRARMTPGG